MLLYAPFPSRAKNKKYSVYVEGPKGPRLIHFGDSRYEQFKDTLGHYARLDHGDKERRRRYYARHGRTRDKNTALYWANRVLWPED